MERTDQFIGQSLAFLDAVERASRAAPLNRPVLVIGERGTGKELIAERLHHLSSRWAGPLIIMPPDRKRISVLRLSHSDRRFSSSST